MKMKILVINGDCVQVNTSANLCHLAYIRGLVDAGHQVTLLSADGRDYQTDPAMRIPDSVECHTYYGVSLYEKLSLRRKSKGASAPRLSGGGAARPPGLKERLIRAAKDSVRALYGVHGTYKKFVTKAKRFRSAEKYDCVISLSTPVTSHLLAHELLRRGRILSDDWIQVWEDPWYSDAYGFNRRPEVLKEERRLLSFAQRVCYVSPVTLENQKKLFPKSADKMYWQPLPSYYSASAEENRANPKTFGYFGDYNLPARDLRPFYEAAVACGVRVNICGGTNLAIESTDRIRICPRLPLGELKPTEDRTGVLVYLCNRAGGQIPGKIYQYSATNKTILFILDGTEAEKQAIRAFFEPFHRYVFCENTEEDIEHAIRMIVNGDLGPVQNRPLTDFEPKKIVQRILDEGMN